MCVTSEPSIRSVAKCSLEGSHLKHVVETAQAAHNLCNHPSLDVFGTIKTKHPGNIERDFHQRMKCLYGLKLRPRTISVRVRGASEGSTDNMVLHCFAPYEYFANLWEAGPQFDFAMLNGNSHLVGQFWDGLARSEVGHFVSTDAELAARRDSLIPVFVHMDGGEVFKGTELLIWSWNSALCFDKSSWDCRHYLTCIPGDIVIAETIEDMVTYLEWNFTIMLSGVHPEKDFGNIDFSDSRSNLAKTPLAGGWACAFAGCLHDLKEQIRQHRYERNYMANFFCDKCLANKHLPMGNGYDFRVGAGWKTMLLSHSHYLATHLGSDRSPWAQVRGWSIFRCREDLLHNAYLGWGKDVAGQLIFDLSYQHGAGANMNDNLAMLQTECAAYFKTVGLRVSLKRWSTATISWSSWNDYPTLETRMKAAVAKHVLLWACQKVAT